MLPSALPSQAQIIYSGDPLAMSMADGDDGPTATAVLEGVEAGSSLGGLKLVLLDEAGAPAAMPVTGKVTVSWHRGHKKISWKGEPIKLPVVKVNDTVNEVATEWIRFQGDASNPITVECALEIRAVPGPPANWAVSLVDQGNSQAADEVGVVQCGRPFSLEIEALDRLNNRCRQDAGAALPEPQVVLQSEGGAPLEFDPGQWEKGWVAQQGNEALYCVRLTMSGPSGPVNITVKDEGGENGASLLGEDCLTVDLRPGPPTALAFEGPSLVQCGMRSALGTLRIGLRDASGFPSAATDSFEVTLASSALATNGSGRAAKVVASGGNKAKMVKGKHGATFSGVTVTAEAPGTYALRVQSTSRKVALEEGVLQVKMLPQSVATALQVVLPGDLAAGGCAAGSPARVLVAVETENGEQLPDDAVVVGLSLRLVPPGGGKSNAVLSTLLAEEDGSLPQEQGAYAFATPELTTAGAWTLTAEYTEPREELRATLGKHAQLRSTAVQLQVLPGAPVTATVQAKSLPDRLVVTNVAAEKQRLLVRNAAVQLEDAHGNAAQPEGCQVRFILRPVGPVGGGEPPVLQASEGPGPKLADELGRAFFGTLTVAEGSGCAPSGALECELVCEALGLYPSSAHDLEVDAEGWTVCWRCPVLFSDDVAQIAAVEKLNERRGALSERRSELQQRLNAAEEAAAAAEQQQQRAAQQADAERKRLPMDVPGTVKEAAKALKVLEKAQAGADDACAGTSETRNAPQRAHGNLPCPCPAENAFFADFIRTQTNPTRKYLGPLSLILFYRVVLQGRPAGPLGGARSNLPSPLQWITSSAPGTKASSACWPSSSPSTTIAWPGWQLPPCAPCWLWWWSRTPTHARDWWPLCRRRNTPRQMSWR